MAKAVRKTLEFDENGILIKPTENSRYLEEEESMEASTEDTVKNIKHLEDSLKYLGELLYWFPQGKRSEKQDVALKWYRELQEIEENDSLEAIQKLQKTLDILQLLLFGKCCKTF